MLLTVGAVKGENNNTYSFWAFFPAHSGVQTTYLSKPKQACLSDLDSDQSGNILSSLRFICILKADNGTHCLWSWRDTFGSWIPFYLCMCTLMSSWHRANTFVFCSWWTTLAFFLSRLVSIGSMQIKFSLSSSVMDYLAFFGSSVLHWSASWCWAVGVQWISRSYLTCAGWRRGSWDSIKVLHCKSKTKSSKMLKHSVTLGGNSLTG